MPRSRQAQSSTLKAFRRARTEENCKLWARHFWDLARPYRLEPIELGGLGTGDWIEHLVHGERVFDLSPGSGPSGPRGPANLASDPGCVRLSAAPRSSAGTVFAGIQFCLGSFRSFV